jgi:hypothetical protein
MWCVRTLPLVRVFFESYYARLFALVPPPMMRAFPLPWVRRVLESVFRDVTQTRQRRPGWCGSSTGWTTVQTRLLTGFTLRALAPMSFASVIFRRLLAEPPAMFDRVLLESSHGRQTAAQGHLHVALGEPRLACV